MGIRIVQVDAFTNRPFAGNPAAVCVLPHARPDPWMRDVAREMNLSETAFLVPQDGGYHLRWLTPAVEVDLCGHATVASRAPQDSSQAPKGNAHLKAQAPQAFEPGSFGQSAQELRRDILVPSAHTGEFMTMSAAKEGGKHHADDFAQELLLSPQAAFDLSH